MVWPFRAGAEQGSVLGHTRESLRLLQDLGRASTTRGVETLGKLTQKGIDVASSGVALAPVAALPLLLQRHASAGVAAAMRFEKDAPGFGLLLLDRPDALRLVDLLLQKPLGTTTQFASLEESALGETANIALNQMVTMVARASGLAIRTTAPETTLDVRARLAALAKPPAGEDHVVLVETSFLEKGANVKGTMALGFFVKAGK